MIYHLLHYIFQTDSIFSDVHILQGSAATCLRRGGLFKHSFVANLLPSPTVKQFENRLIFDEVMGKGLWRGTVVERRSLTGELSVLRSTCS